MDSWIQGEVDLDTALSRINSGEMPIQREFLYCPEKVAAAAGGFRAAKTVTACCWQILLGYQVPNSLHLVGRLNKPALKDTTQRTFMELMPREWVKEWREAESRMVMRNGAEYLFRHLEITDAELAGHIRSLNLTSFLVDQAEEISEGTFNTLYGRLSRKTDPLAHFGRLVLNPAGQDWIWRKFFDKDRAEHFQKFKGFVMPTTANASNLPSEYISDLLATYPSDWAERFIYGSFADFSDLVYKDFNQNIHVYDATWRPPLDWPVYVGIDIGGVDPWSFTFGAVDPENGNIYVFDEIYEAGIRISELAEKYHAIMVDRNFQGMAYDYENQQAAIEMEEYGICGSNAIKAVMPGIMKMGQYMHPDPRITSRFNGKSPAPRIYYSRKCVNHIREITGYKWAKDNKGVPTGQPHHDNSHSPSSTRYMIHTFRPEPEKLPKSRLSQMEGLDAASRLYWMRCEQEEENKKNRSKSVNSPFLPNRKRLPFSRIGR